MKRIVVVLFQGLGIVSIGLFVRYRQGPSMFDPFFFIPFSCISAILVGALQTKLHEQSEEPAPTQVRRTVIRACLWMSMILLVSLLSLNLMPWSGGWLLPEWTTLIDAALLSVTVTTAMAAFMALLLARFPPQVAKWTFRALIFTAILMYSTVPPQWTGRTIAAVLDHGLTTVALSLAAALAVLDAGLLRLLARSSGATGNKTQVMVDL